jgi:transposase
MYIKYPIELNDEQRQYLEKITSSGTSPAREIKHAQILLKSDWGVNWSYEQISKAFDVCDSTITKVRKAFVKNGLEAALQRKRPDREYEHALDGDAEAHLIALACSAPPTGREHWSLRLLQDRFVKLGYSESISHETIRRVLKKRKLSLG